MKWQDSGAIYEKTTVFRVMVTPGTNAKLPGAGCISFDAKGHTWEDSIGQHSHR